MFTFEISSYYNKSIQCWYRSPCFNVLHPNQSKSICFLVNSYTCISELRKNCFRTHLINGLSRNTLKWVPFLFKNIFSKLPLIRYIPSRQQNMLSFYKFLNFSFNFLTHFSWYLFLFVMHRYLLMLCAMLKH